MVSSAILLIVGGIFACAPLFKQVSKGLERLFIILGFATGIGIIIVAIYGALNFQFLSGILGTSVVPGSGAFAYAGYYLVVMGVLGVLLFSRPLRNVRWASLISLAIAVFAALELHLAFGGLNTLELGIVFIIVLLVLYTLLRFVEDILEFIGSVLAFPPVAIVIGLVSIYFGILAYNV